MSATLWDILLCILIDENVEEDFWEFAKSSNLLSEKQITLKKPEATSFLLRKTQDQPYIKAATHFAKSPQTPEHISQKILRNIKWFYERHY